MYKLFKKQNINIIPGEVRQRSNVDRLFFPSAAHEFFGSWSIVYLHSGVLSYAEVGNSCFPFVRQTALAAGRGRESLAGRGVHSCMPVKTAQLPPSPAVNYAVFTGERSIVGVFIYPPDRGRRVVKLRVPDAVF